MKPGDEVIVRLPRPGGIPADSALGQKRDTVQNFRLTVSGIIPADGLGRFGLRPTQHLPLNAYIELEVVAGALGATRPGKRHFCAFAKWRAKKFIRRRFKGAESAAAEIGRSRSWR